MISGIFILIMMCLVQTFHFSNQTNIKEIKAPNHRPVVKILTPKSGTVRQWGSEIRYQIRVSDQEDGDSRYQEISPNEVNLKILYEPDPSKIKADTSNSDHPDPAGLAVIRNSNCGNCHSMKSKVIGPSYSEVSHKYPDSSLNIKKIAEHIIDGSTGIWGSLTMPSHPGLTQEQAEKAVSWILKNGSNPDLNYRTGLEGVIHFKRPVNATSGGVYILTATYTDHGTKSDPTRRLKGSDVVIIHLK